ncbi:MAG: sulfatase-like hydrolase/transferase [Planctomycetota bacterium]
MHRLLLALAFFSLFVLGGARGYAAEQPNVILVFVDDLGYGNLGCYGQEKIQTPVVDQMASEGLKFTRFYAGAPLCLPSRCALMTGQHMGHSRCRVNGGGGNHQPIEREDMTLSRMLKRAGYTTGMAGKWALGDEFLGNVVEKKNKDGSGALYHHGWDFYYGEPNQTYNHSYFPDNVYRYDPSGLVGEKTPRDRLEVVPYDNPGGRRTVGNDYRHDRTAEQALKFIDAVKDKRFFLYLPFTTPHADFIVPELEPYTQEQDWPENAKAFASMITRTDRHVGEILQRLRRHGITENTLVLFTSDNGGLSKFDSIFDNNGPLEGFKGDLKEGGVRVPCVAYWPGTIEAGRTTDQLFAFWDLMPTLAELAGLPCPRPTDGVSFVPALLGKRQQEKHDYLFFGRGSPKNSYIVRAPHEDRSDQAILEDAHSKEVTVARFPD